MEFILISFGFVALIVVVLVLPGSRLSRAAPTWSDWPSRSYEDEALLELEDVQAIDAQNAYRRKRGAEELTEAAYAMAREDEEAWRRWRER